MKNQKPEPKKLKAPKDLNDGQGKVFIDLMSYLEDPADRSVYVLKGWAGTGKTYTVSKLINHIISDRKSSRRVAVTGPTNKSVKVIKQSTGIMHSNVIYSTIHRLLGLTEKITNDGRQEFVRDDYIGSAIDNIDILFIDEVSMLNDDLFHEIIKQKNRIKIICMGDPCQIPPVGKADCIPFSDLMHPLYGISTVELKEVMRQKNDNPIISQSVIIRKNISQEIVPLETVTKRNPEGHGIVYLNLDSTEDRSEFTDRITELLTSPEFKTNPDLVKIIAWRNKTVDRMNHVARKKIYGEEAETSPILLGERMIVNSPVIMKDTVVLNTNEEFEIESFKIVTDNIRIQINDKPNPPLEVKLKYYLTQVSYYSDLGSKLRTTIHILHQDSKEEYQKVLNLLKLKAIEKRGADKSWVKYYNFMRKFADVNFSYSITAHKAQGSTYENVFVLDDDINVNRNVIERNRIRYTAFTRASKNLYVLKKF